MKFSGSSEEKRNAAFSSSRLFGFLILVVPLCSVFAPEILRADFVAHYDASVPEAHRAAINQALDIWRKQLGVTSSQIVDVNIGTFEEPRGSLAKTSEPTWAINFAGAPQSGTLYSLAAMNIFTNTNSNGSAPEIEISYNTSYSWYAGLDKNPAPDEYDLITTMIHEVTHGLGFWKTVQSNGSWGRCWNGTTVPTAWDRQLGISSGAYLINLGNPIPTSKWVAGTTTYWQGDAGMAADPRPNTLIYNPAPWQSGSNLSHLDESTYNGIFEMMSPSGSPGEALHEIGPIMQGMLIDMGYTDITDMRKSWAAGSGNWSVPGNWWDPKHVQTGSIPGWTRVMLQYPGDFAAATTITVDVNADLIDLTNLARLEVNGGDITMKYDMTNGGVVNISNGKKIVAENVYNHDWADLPKSGLPSPRPVIRVTGNTSLLESRHKLEIAYGDVYIEGGGRASAEGVEVMNTMTLNATGNGSRIAVTTGVLNAGTVSVEAQSHLSANEFLNKQWGDLLVSGDGSEAVFTSTVQGTEDSSIRVEAKGKLRAYAIENKGSAILSVRDGVSEISVGTSIMNQATFDVLHGGLAEANLLSNYGSTTIRDSNSKLEITSVVSNHGFIEVADQGHLKTGMLSNSATVQIGANSTLAVDGLLTNFAGSVITNKGSITSDSFQNMGLLTLAQEGTNPLPTIFCRGDWATATSGRITGQGTITIAGDFTNISTQGTPALDLADIGLVFVDDQTIQNETYYVRPWSGIPRTGGDLYLQDLILEGVDDDHTSILDVNGWTIFWTGMFDLQPYTYIIDSMRPDRLLSDIVRQVNVGDIPDDAHRLGSLHLQNAERVNLIAIPEPASWLLAIAMIAMVFSSRRVYPARIPGLIRRQR